MLTVSTEPTTTSDGITAYDAPFAPRIQGSFCPPHSIAKSGSPANISRPRPFKGPWKKMVSGPFSESTGSSNGTHENADGAVRESRLVKELFNTPSLGTAVDVPVLTSNTAVSSPQEYRTR